MKKKIDTKAGIYSIGCTTITIFKYFCLALAIVYLGSFIAAGIIFFLKGNTIEESVIARIYSYVTYYGYNDAISLIRLIGKTRAKAGLLGYAFIYSIHYGLIYVLLFRFKEIFKSIINNKIFTLKNINLLYDSLKLGLVLTFTQPFLMMLNIVVTHAFLNFSSFDFSGIMFLFVAVLLYMVFVSGYNLEKKQNEYDIELEDYRAQISDLEIEKLKEKTQNDKKEEEKEEKTSTTRKRRRRKKKPATKTTSE